MRHLRVRGEPPDPGQAMTIVPDPDQGTLAFRSLPVFAPDEAERIAALVMACSEHWTRRDPDNPFFTLGAASYLDGADAYRERSLRDNPLLETGFGAWWEAVRAALEATLGEPVEVRPDAARPGFHLHGWCPLFEFQAGRIHTDRQYQRLAWDAADRPDFSRPLSFTLPVRLPRGGGGLDLWPLQLHEIEGRSAEELRPLFRARPPVFHPYQVGHLVVHSGHQVHRIAALPKGERDAWRIAWQGHGIRCRGTWRVYW